jgi:hypothetical protein
VRCAPSCCVLRCVSRSYIVDFIDFFLLYIHAPLFILNNTLSILSSFRLFLIIMQLDILFCCYKICILHLPYSITCVCTGGSWVYSFAYPFARAQHSHSWLQAPLDPMTIYLFVPRPLMRLEMGPPLQEALYLLWCYAFLLHIGEDCTVNCVQVRRESSF